MCVCVCVCVCVPQTENYHVWAEPSSRNFIRKAGNDFGWDWGPAYIPSGITAPVTLFQSQTKAQAQTQTQQSIQGAISSVSSIGKVSGLMAVMHIAPDFSSVTITPRLRVTALPLPLPLPASDSTTSSSSSSSSGGREVGVEVEVDMTVLLDEVEVLRTTQTVDLSPLSSSLPSSSPAAAPPLPFTDVLVGGGFELTAPRLWFPAGYGAQHRYTLTVLYCPTSTGSTGSTASSAPSWCQSISRKVGVRTVELVQVKAEVYTDPSSPSLASSAGQQQQRQRQSRRLLYTVVCLSRFTALTTN